MLRAGAALIASWFERRLREGIDARRAEIITYDRHTDDREAIGNQICARWGRFCSPVVAGTIAGPRPVGTAGRGLFG
jgi:hypothetical protein